MTSIPINAADRATIVAEIDAVATQMAIIYDAMAPQVQSAMIVFGQSISSLRQKLQRPSPASIIRNARAIEKRLVIDTHK